MNEPTLKGLYNASTYRVWIITAPYSSDKYMFAGSKEDAEAAGEEMFKDWTYPLHIREIGLERRFK